TPGGILWATITNTFTRRQGSLIVAKHINGPAAASRGPVTLVVSCSDGTGLAKTYPTSVQPDPFIVGPLPFGTLCSIAGTETGAVPGDVDVTGPTFDPGPAVVIDRDLVPITVDDFYDFATGSVQLVKQFAGPAAGERGDVRLSLQCGTASADIM